jgi:hypothetical protein
VGGGHQNRSTVGDQRMAMMAHPPWKEVLRFYIFSMKLSKTANESYYAVCFLPLKKSAMTTIITIIIMMNIPK